MTQFMRTYTGSPPPQQFCGQPQAHSTHEWVTSQNMYASCAGCTGDIQVATQPYVGGSALLRKYMRHVFLEEGSTSICSRPNMSGVEWTDIEWSILESISKEVEK